MQPWLSWYLLCSPCWPQIMRSVPASPVLAQKLCATMSGFSAFYMIYLIHYFSEHYPGSFGADDLVPEFWTGTESSSVIPMAWGRTALQQFFVFFFFFQITLGSIHSHTMIDLTLRSRCQPTGKIQTRETDMVSIDRGWWEK